jgi:L-alanine-DL-glutamate epimerase-like enolase superfamily enzyme
MKLNAEPMDLVTKHVFGISRNAAQAFHNVLVTVEAGGRKGLGEAAPTEFYGEDQASTMRALESMAEALKEKLGAALMARLRPWGRCRFTCRRS